MIWIESISIRNISTIFIKQSSKLTWIKDYILLAYCKMLHIFGNKCFYIIYFGEHSREGVRVKGFLAWTLLDDFEWQAGYTERFGLTYVDFNDNLKRTPKLSLKWFNKFLKTWKDVSHTPSCYLGVLLYVICYCNLPKDYSYNKVAK